MRELQAMKEASHYDTVALRYWSNRSEKTRNMISVSSPRFSVLCTLLSMPCSLCMPMLQPFTSEGVPTEKYR